MKERNAPQGHKLVYDLVEEHKEKSDVQLIPDIVKLKIWFNYVMMSKAKNAGEQINIPRAFKYFMTVTSIVTLIS